MTLTIRYRLGKGKGIDTVTLYNVQTITQSGANAYDVTCFGNGPVTWRNVTSFVLALDVTAPTAPASKPAPAPVAPTGETVMPTIRAAKVYQCYKCGAYFTFKREASSTEPGLQTLSRIETATGKPHECQGRAASAIVIETK